MPGTLYLSDLDGTLLNPEKKLSGYTIDTLNALIEKGLPFAYATARSFTSARIVTEGLLLRLPVITYNGAFVVDPSTGQPLVRRMFDRADVAPLLDDIRARRIPALLYAQIDGEERVSYRPADVNRQVREYLAERGNDPRMRAVDTFDQLFEGELFYITVLAEEQVSRSLMERAQAIESCTHQFQRDIYGQRDWWLEIYQKQSKKSIAAQTLCENLGYDRVVCFGDHLNDLSLFEISDECYAVSNAEPEVRRAATAVIGSNAEDGVARWLAENF